VALVRTDVSEDRNASIIMVTRIGEPGKLAATSKEILCEKRRVMMGIKREGG
jgi:hypothetical protein